ncbi:MAG: COG1470 family protein, partial [Planctomycetota bacterium]
RVPIDELGDEVTFITIEGVSILSEQEQLKAHPLLGLIVRKDTMLIKIGNVPKLQLTTNEPEKYIMPGEKAKFKVYVKNNGNVDYSVSLSHSEPSSGWLVSMPTSIDVRSLESKLVEVFLTAPGEEHQVKAETREMITVEGLVDTAKGVLTSSVGVVGVMDHVYHLNVSVRPTINTTSPGGMVLYDVTIENLGNGDDEIKLSPLSLELGWNMTFSKGEEFFIEWKESLMIGFELRVPYNALAGVYASILNVSDSNPHEKNFVTVKTRVLQSYDMSIGTYNEDYDLYMASTTQFVTPGSSTIVTR